MTRGAALGAAAAAFLCATGFALIVLWTPARADAEIKAVARVTSRCPSCGWIESRRNVPGTGEVQVYEYTLRMTDGSSRVFREALLPRSLRERVTYIDGTPD
jgi:hypothetical protein